MHDRIDTIFAPATGGAGAVAVVRISGSGAVPALARLSAGRLPEVRQASLRRLTCPHGGGELDEAVVLRFAAPASYTGEDVVELHLHGGHAVVQGVLAALAGLPGLRPAEPGEFTRRAVVNGRMDLTRAEGVADLVAAATASQRRQALRQLDGRLEALCEGWRAQLVRLLAECEASIDFVDEELPADLETSIREGIERLRGEMAAHLAAAPAAERLRTGVEVVIVGPPNVGKSSLLNTLAGRDAAIVSGVAGTTRDVVEVSIDIDGVPVRLADTAGLRESADAIEREGVRRARERAARADLVLLVADARDWPDSGGADRTLLGSGEVARVIRFWNKSDLRSLPDDVLAGSTRADGGLDALLEAIRRELAAGGDAEAALLTRPRHRAALEACCDALRRAVAVEAIELAAEEMRAAAHHLGRITGRVDVEDLLDVVFREFCIGK